MKIAIDFDGTCVTHEFPKVGKDIGAASVLKALVRAGHSLILYTMRSNTKGNTGFSDCVPEVHNGNFLDDAINWFKENDIELYGIQSDPHQTTWTSSPKCYAELYIDDAALGVPLVFPVNERPFVNWEVVRSNLKDMGLIT